MVATLLFAYVLPAAEVGAFFVAQSAVLMISQFTRLGLDRQIILRNARRGTVRHAANAFELLLYAFVAGCAGLIGSMLLFVAQPILSRLYGQEVATMIAQLAPAVPVFTMLLLVSAWLKSEDSPEIGVFFEIGGVNLLMILAFIVWPRDLPLLFLISVGVMALIGVAVFAARGGLSVIKRLTPRRCWRGLARVRLSFGLGALNVLLFLGTNLSMLLGGLFLPAAELAKIRVAERLGFAIGFPLIVQSSIIPTRFAREVRRTGGFDLRAHARLVAACLAFSLAACGLIAAAYYMGLSSRLGAAYEGWFPVWVIFAIGYTLCVAIGPTESVAAAVGLGRQSSIAVAAWLLVYAAVVALGIGPLGAMAVGIGFSAYAVGLRLSAALLLLDFIRKPKSKLGVGTRC